MRRILAEAPFPYCTKLCGKDWKYENAGAAPAADAQIKKAPVPKGTDACGNAAYFCLSGRFDLGGPSTSDMTNA